MAISSSTRAIAPGKSYPASIHYEPPTLIGGLVQHALISASTQVQILSIVDEAGSATVADIVAGLPAHPDPVGAIQVMVELKILVSEIRGVLDGNTIVRRAGPELDPQATTGAPASPRGAGGLTVISNTTEHESASSTIDWTVPVGLSRLETTPFSANVVVGPGASRRAFSRMSELRRPGVYVLLSDTEAYVGTGADVGLRVASGQQPIAEIKTVVVITDRNGALTETDALAAERMLWARVNATGERLLVNGLPDGSSLGAQHYSELDVLLGQACLTLRHHGLMFSAGSARSVLSGPRHEPGRVGPLRPFNMPPRGVVLELTFGAGLVALAARQSDTRWILLQGSDVSISTVASANSTTRYLRAAWLHNGLIEVSPDGRSYITKRDLIFRSGSGLAQFCAGSKGRTLECWKPIDPTGGYDPETATLIAA